MDWTAVATQSVIRKSAAADLAFTQLAAIRTWLRAHDSTLPRCQPFYFTAWPSTREHLTCECRNNVKPDRASMLVRKQRT